MYYFGIYHWRNGVLPLASLGAAGLFAAGASRLSRPASVVSGAAAVGLGAYGAVGVERLLHPRPWSLDRELYDRLAADLPLADADRVLDVGCGTGRSLVGLAPHLPADCDVTGVDRFDDRIIFGNAPALARRNAERAGLDPSVVTGDGAALPFADDSFDVVTACLVLHDLPERESRAILSEMRRVCAPGGSVGLVELPMINDERPVSGEFWRDLVEDAGFTVASARPFSWAGGGAFGLVGESGDEASGDVTMSSPVGVVVRATP